MRKPRMVSGLLGFAVLVGSGMAAQNQALSEEYRGSWEQQMACTPDVMRLCGDQIPDTGRIVACLRQNTRQLSNGCRAVFESNASTQQKPPRTPQQAAPGARATPPVQVAPVQPRPYDEDW